MFLYLRSAEPNGFEHPAFSRAGKPCKGLSVLENIAGYFLILPFVLCSFSVLGFCAPIYILPYLSKKGDSLLR